VAIADMFLKMTDVTGEARDADHQGQIEVSAWSWGVESALSRATIGTNAGGRESRPNVRELSVTKRVDRATVTLVQFLITNKTVSEASLIVRKAGQTPLEYFVATMSNVRVTSVGHETQNAEIVERVTLAFDELRLKYTPQGPTGGRGGGDLETVVTTKPSN
jgi:type VI secretion system secreted protein Hcp